MLALYENIKRLRQEHGMTQEELAKKLGYTDRSIVAKIESGAVDLSTSRIIAIANVFGVSPTQLMGWADDSDAQQNSSHEYISSSGEKYYFSDEAAAVAQEVYEDSSLRMLFDAARDAKPEDLKMAADMLKRFKGTNPDG